jgi:hypothetical protein
MANRRTPANYIDMQVNKLYEPPSRMMMGAIRYLIYGIIIALIVKWLSKFLTPNGNRLPARNIYLSLIPEGITVLSQQEHMDIAITSFNYMKTWSIKEVGNKGGKMLDDIKEILGERKITQADLAYINRSFGVLPYDGSGLAGVLTSWFGTRHATLEEWMDAELNWFQKQRFINQMCEEGIDLPFNSWKQTFDKVFGGLNFNGTPNYKKYNHKKLVKEIEEKLKYKDYETVKNEYMNNAISMGYLWDEFNEDISIDIPDGFLDGNIL